MADYIPITNTQIEPKAPVTSELMNQLRDNPIAIAEGSDGAPKVVAKAQGAPLHQAGTGETLNLDNYNSAVIMGSIFANYTGATSASAQIRYRRSTNNGATWEAFTNLVNITVTDTDDIKYGADEVVIDLTGYNAISLDYQTNGDDGNLTVNYQISAKIYGGAPV